MNNKFIEIYSVLTTNMDIIKSIVMFIFTFIINYKVLNKKLTFEFKKIISYFFVVILSIICGIVRYKIDFFVSTIYLVIILGLVTDRENIKDSFIATIISLTINYVIDIFAIIIAYLPNKVINNLNDTEFAFFTILSIRLIMLIIIVNIKKFKYGFTFIRKNKKETYIDIFILNISIIILFAIIIFENSNKTLARDNIGIEVVLLAIVTTIFLQKSFDLYYKQKLLIQDLNETKEELNKKNEEITKLEAENLSFSKKSHSLAHKQKSLEYKLNQLMLKTETAEEIDLKQQLDKVSNELYSETEMIELPKTGITQIDDMLKYMQSECKENKIDFDLQITGNIYQMTNNHVTKEELEILLADHIKDAIIAINHTDNINRSILVRLGKIDEIYSLYIYDSGIEFEQETLENLGKIPITTHPDEGGTGMGFMNTFETLRKHNASLIIKEIGKPSKENYTKIIMIKFDNKNEFKIETYKK